MFWNMKNKEKEKKKKEKERRWEVGDDRAAKLL